MRSCTQGLILIVLAGTIVPCGRAAGAGPADTGASGVPQGGLVAPSFAPRRGSDEGVAAREWAHATSRWAAAQQAPVPFDPVIEEPLRPLFPGGQGLSPAQVARCGSMGSAILPVGIMLLGATSFVRRPGRR